MGKVKSLLKAFLFLVIVTNFVFAARDSQANICKDVFAKVGRAVGVKAKPRTSKPQSRAQKLPRVKDMTEEEIVAEMEALEYRPLAAFFASIRKRMQNPIPKSPRTRREQRAYNRARHIDLDKAEEAVKVPDEELREFDIMFGRYSELEATNLKRRDAGAFEKWWAKRKDTALAPQVLEQYMAEGYTFKQFRDAMLRKFRAEHVARDRGWVHNTFIRPVRNPRVRNYIVKPALRTTEAVAHLLFKGGRFTTGILKGAIVAGPIAGIVAAYLEPAVGPVRNKAAQQGADDLKEFVGWLNENVLSDKEIARGEEALDRLKKETESLKQLEGLDPQAALKLWGQKQLDFYKNFSVIQRALRADERQGRSLMWELQYQTPIAMAESAATFRLEASAAQIQRNQLLNHADQMKLLREALKKDLTPEEAEREKKKLDAELEKLRTDLDAANQRMATALAGWKVREFMYRELVKPVPGEDINSTRTKDYDTMVKSLRFDLYINEVQDDLQEAINALEVELNTKKMIREMVEKAPDKVKQQIEDQSKNKEVLEEIKKAEEQEVQKEAAQDVKEEVAEERLQQLQNTRRRRPGPTQ